MSSRQEIRSFRRALPFWLSLGMIPLAVLGALVGGWALILLPLYGWTIVTGLDLLLGRNEDQPDTETPETDLFWYRLITMIWFPIQIVTQFSLIYYVTHSDHLSTLEAIGLFFGVGVVSGTIGIVYAHELMHQKNRIERWLADLLLASVLYSHFRSEHLLVHHWYVGTPRDSVTARYNEGFHRFFLRVLRDCPRSAWATEVRKLARAKRPALHLSNPFWRYGALQLAMLALAFALGGIAGVGLFAF